MKKVILLALLMPHLALAQIVEDFEPGNLINWIQYPSDHWISDTSGSISGLFSLHHTYDNSDSGGDIIGIPINDLHISEGFTAWSFLLKYEYDPSSSNNWAIFLISDSEPAELSTESQSGGFAVGVNLIGYDDTLRLWKVKNGIITEVVNTHVNWQSDVGNAEITRIVVGRNAEGKWTISVFNLNEELLGSASGTDNEIFNSEWFEILYRYTSTRDRLLWFDDLTIDGIFYTDINPPRVAECKVSSRNSIDITLTESPSGVFITDDNFLLNGCGNCVLSVNKISGQTFRIEFTQSFNNKMVNEVIIRDICDKYANCDKEVKVLFKPVWAESCDVIISEIMADPVPEVSLPGKEYIELTNRTGFTFNLANWKLISEDQKYNIGEAVIGPNEIAIVCLSKDTLSFNGLGKVIGLKQFPALTNEGKLLCLVDSLEYLVHGVEYSSEWYSDELKSSGGWSLEIVDPDFPFYFKGNWKASRSRNGGTPGSVNSVIQSNPDMSFMGIQYVFPVENNKILIRFTEPVFNFPENISAIKIEGEKIISVRANDLLCREFIINIEESLMLRHPYLLSVDDALKDFAGNPIQISKVDFGLAESAEINDILFNELMFNPYPGDPDYIELLNCSDKIVDASRLQIVSVNDELCDTSQLYAVSGDNRCIMPGSYYAITTNREKISERYISTDPQNLFEVKYLPAMPDDGGHLILFNRELDKIDEVIYNDNMHYYLLSEDEGIALERIDPKTASLIADNWHSASEIAGWGTPGAPNSMNYDLTNINDNLIFSSSKITPDSDGYDDVLKIGITMTGNGNVLSVTVFDEDGRYVRQIAENMFAGNEAALIWDGTADDGSLVPTGIYIIFINLFDDTGKVKQFKKVCTVLRSR